jgi:hypothetical protein
MVGVINGHLCRLPRAGQNFSRSLELRRPR